MRHTIASDTGHFQNRHFRKRCWARHLFPPLLGVHPKVEAEKVSKMPAAGHMGQTPRLPAPQVTALNPFTPKNSKPHRNPVFCPIGGDARLKVGPKYFM